MDTFIEKMLGKKAGEVTTIEPDYIVINDGVSNVATDEISSVACPEKLIVIYDHDVPTGRPEAAAILRKNLEFAKKYNLRYEQAKGIGYQYMLDEVVKQGEIIIGGGSHGSIFGAVKALGINVSVPELARIVETGRYSVIVPDTYYINLNGKPKEGVSVIDVALYILKEHKDETKGKAIEVYAPEISQAEKAVLMSMICIGGAYTAVVRDERAEEGKDIELSRVETMVMLPCEKRTEQGNAEITEKKNIAELEFQAGQIGGYTGGTIEELRKAAKLIEGKKLKLGFRLSISPVTSRTYIKACEEGLITKFIDFGAQINAAGDHSEVIQGAGAIGKNEKLVTTGLYTYKGAMGVESSAVYTSSVENIINAAYTGRI